MAMSTWQELQDYFCSNFFVKKSGAPVPNPHHENMSKRRYNYSTASDLKSCRLVFLKSVLDEPTNKTLVRSGRFIWCSNLNYEGVGDDGLRQISFTVDKGSKRFFVAENNVLCVPANIFINNGRYFRKKDKTFKAFSSVFSYSNAVKIMAKQCDEDLDNIKKIISLDNPYKPGTLVAPRLGYFYPVIPPPGTADRPSLDDEHPYGIIIGPSFDNSDFSGREFYRVRFAGTTYERVHPVQMEIINEV